MFPLTPIPPYYLESWIRGGNSKWWHFLFDTFKSIASMLDLRKAIINYSDLSVNKYKEIVVKYKRFFLAFPHLLILNAGILNRDVKSILRERISILNDRINSQSFV